jgi:hypothetical protein
MNSTIILKGLIGFLCWIGWGNGIMAIIFGWMIATDNALPSATGSFVMFSSLSAMSYLSAGTLALVKHA